MKPKKEHEKSPIEYKQRVLHVFCLLLASAAIIFIFHLKPWEGCAVPRYRGYTGYEETNWVLKKGDEIIDPQLALPAFWPLESGETYSMSSTLTFDGSNDGGNDNNPYCFYFVDHMYTRVLLDGELIFSYFPEDIQKQDRSKSPGNVYASAPLPDDCQGKELVIEFIPSLDARIEYELPHPNFSNYYSYSQRVFVNNLPHNIIVVLLVFLGLVFILFSTLAMSGTGYREGLFIGIFAVLFGLYNITESDFDFYVISNPYFTYLLDYVTFSLSPIFFMAFFRERMDPLRKKIMLWVILANTAIVMTEFALHFTGVMDMREFLPILHIADFISVVLIMALLLTMRKNSWKKHLIVQLIPIIIGMCIDVSIYYAHWESTLEDSTFTALGILAFLIAENYHIWRYSIKVYTESIRSRSYREMAFVDSLTGIGNRRAMEAEKAAITDGDTSYRTMIIASADINNLKITNDKMGHAAGDLLIRNSANVLSDFSEGYGKAFRTGGDEFLVFLYDMEDAEFEQRLQKLQRQIDEINSNSEIKLSLALGHEKLMTPDIEEAIAKADRKMYLSKDQFKAEQNITAPC